MYFTIRENGSRPVTSPAYCTKVGTICPPTPISKSIAPSRMKNMLSAGSPFAEDHLAGPELHHLAVAGQPLELLVGQPGEDLDATQFGGKRAAHSITSSW